MPATAVMHTIVHPRLHCFGLAPASLSATTTAHTAAPGRRTFRVIDDRDSCRVTAKLLIIDKELVPMAGWLRQAFPAPAHRVQVAATGADGLAQVRIDPPDVILLDPRLPDQSGLEVYEQIRQIDARIPVIFITMTKAADAAIEAMKQGAYDYLFKPLDPHQLRKRGRRGAGSGPADARAGRRQEAETAPDPDLDGAIVGSCPAMREVYKAIGRVAAQNVPVLITGESGTGKELVARAIYQHGPRAKAPFLALNCAAIPENLLESELFGHEKGAFTGADRRRIGKFEQCHGGTLFLDEIGDMPPALAGQDAAPVLQEQIIRTRRRQRDDQDQRADHRGHPSRPEGVVSRRKVPARPVLPAGRLHDPPAPLRERGDDLPLLVHHYLRRFSRELGREVGEVAPDALEPLRGYAWPGNIRELQSVLKQALLKARGTTLLPDHLPALAGETGGSVPASPSAGDDPNLEAFLRQCLTCRRRRPVCAGTPPAGPALFGPRPGANGRESAQRSTQAGDRAANPAPQAKRAGTPPRPVGLRSKNTSRCRGGGYPFFAYM